jgi:hypothetical protein
MVSSYPDSFRKWLPSASKKELRWLAKQDLYHPDNRELLSRELSIRVALSPHWSLTPTFWAILVTMFLTGIVAGPIVLEWIREALDKSSRTEVVPAPQKGETPEPSATPSTGASPLPFQETSSPDATPRSESQPRVQRRSKARS